MVFQGVSLNLVLDILFQKRSLLPNGRENAMETKSCLC